MSTGHTPHTWLDAVLDTSLGFLALITLIITNLGVILRYVFQIAMPWNEEIVKFLFVWMIFVGFAQAYRQGLLAGILFLEESLEKRHHTFCYRLVKIAQGLVNCSFGAFCVYCGWDIMQFQMETEEVTTVLEIPLYAISAGFTVGFALFTAYSFLGLARQIKQ